MTSKSYWARRMKMLKEGIAQDHAKDVEYIDRQYNKAIKEIDSKIRAWYQRIADNNGVSYAEAQRMLSKSELKDFRMSIEEYIEKGLSGGFEKELENASARVHISRLEALEMELQAHAEELTGKRIARTESALKDAYTEMYYHTGYEVQQMAGVGVNMRKVDKKRLENVLARPWAADEQTFTARCWTDKQRLVHKLETELTRMVATGASPDKAIKNISDAFNTSKANARRLVLTESAAMASVAEQDCYKELDVEEYEIVGTFDANMCSDCASLDGEHFPCKDFKIGVNAPPFHPNCYCTTVPYYDDMAGIGERWMRNPDTGKGEWIPSDMKYDDWKDIYIDKNSTLDDWKAKHKANKTNKAFLPAKTKQEAERYAKERFAESVDFSGVSLEVANAVNQRLYELSEKYPIGRLETINTGERRKTALMSARYDSLNLNGGKLKTFKGYSADRYLEVQEKRKEALSEWKSHYEKLKSSYGEKGVPRSVKKTIKELENGLKFTRYNVGASHGKSLEDGVMDCVTHEYGHIIADQYFGQISGARANSNTVQNGPLIAKWGSIFTKARKTGDVYKVSEYGDKNEYEFFAECFAAREHGETLPSYIESFMGRILTNGKL